MRPDRGPDSNTVTNGLLLRADIHTLLDLRVLASDPATRAIVISKLLARARCPTATVTLEAGGTDTYTQRAIPGHELSKCLA